MRCDGNFMAYVEGSRMAGGDVADDDFVRRAAAVFAAEVFKPMFQRATTAPDDVIALMAEIREKLDALDTVIAACAGAGAGADGPGGTGRSVGDRRAGAGWSGGGGVVPAADPRDGLDDVGRNQRSRLRELAILEALAREARPFALQQLTSLLETRGFADTSGAIVSQLHRLKKLGIINQPVNGMYEITDEGLGHMRRVRSSFGALVSGS